MLKQLSIILPRNNHGIFRYIPQALQYSTEAEEIIIPQEIPRGPTDILRALSRTVKPDPTAAHYKYHDDPYLIPYSNLSKRTYALSQEAGRKAAQWIRQQYPELFQHRVAEPIVEAFIPKPVYNEDSNVTEEILKNSITNTCVSDSITIYNILKTKGIGISQDTKQSLLELVCYYNCEDPLNEDWIEEKWYRQGMKSKEKLRNTWKENGFAEQLFKEMGGKNSKSVCALISGMCLHGQLDKAWNLYEQAKANGLKISINTYNSLLTKTCFVKESHTMIMQCITDILQQMKNEKIQPNLETLNAILECLSNISTHNHAKSFALSTLAEFKTLGINPSFASFYHLLNLYHSDRGQLNSVIISSLEYLENNTMKIQDIKDVMFFCHAMEAICQRLRDVTLAYRLNDLLHKDDNYDFIGDSYKESLYYRYYFILLCKTEALDTVMEVYDKLVPNIYIPEPAVMNEILKSLENNAAWHLLPRLWSDIVLFEQADRSSKLERVLSLASKNKDESLKNAMANIGWTIWEKIENSPADRRGALEWTGPLLGYLMIVLLEVEELSKAHLVLDKMERLQDKIVGEPKVAALVKYLELCIKENSLDAAIKCIRYCNNVGFIETDEMARKLYNTLQLSKQQVERLISIVGQDALKLKVPKQTEV